MEKSQSGLSLFKTYENVIIMRSLSKGLGFAGLRAGYMICNKIIVQNYSKITHPFTLSSVAQHFGVIVLSDEAYIANYRNILYQVKK